jgi:glycosyltransferase involved in cell wall biosynthesis
MESADSADRPTYSVVLPCYNEAENIPLLLTRVAALADRGDFELVLVNNGSTDATGDVIASAVRSGDYPFLRCVTVEKNRGYGDGIYQGLRTARGKILAFSHADIQTPPEDVFNAFDIVARGEIDLGRTLIKGFRTNRSSDKEFLTRWLGRVVRVLLGVDIRDVNGQPKVFDRAFLDSLRDPPADFSFDTYLLYRARLQGLDIRTFDVDFGERMHGSSKWASSFVARHRTILRYLTSIVGMAWRHRDESGNPVGELQRFLATGVLTNLVNYGIFLALLWGVGTSYLSASATGFLAGLGVGFFVNQSYTFRAAGSRTAAKMGRFLVVNTLSLGAHLSTIYVVTGGLGIPAELGQLMAIAVSTCINFGGCKLWVFSEGR